MPSVQVLLTPGEAAALRQLAGRAPVGAASSPGRILAWLYRQHLAAQRRVRAAQAQALMQRYWPVARAVAARWFQRLQGALPLDELISAATEEMAKAAHKFDASLGFSPAPYFRRWAEFGVRAYIEAQLGDTSVHPDQDEDGSRWERLGEVDDTLAQAPDTAALAAALRAFAEGLDRAQRRILQLLLRGADDDEVAARAHCEVADVGALRQALAAHLAARGLAPRPDAELTAPEVAQRYGLSAKVVHKALASGTLPGQKRHGAWIVREADARAFVRVRSVVR